MSTSKVMSAEAVAESIADGATVAVPGNASILVPDHLLAALEARFLAAAHPRDLTAFLPCTSSLGPGTGQDRFIHKGMLKRMIAGAYPIYKGSPIVDAIANDEIEAYNLPMGVLYALLREIGAHRPGLLTEVGIDTFVDPRLGGGRLNAATREELVERVTFAGREMLFYRSVPIDVAFLKGTSADAAGNVSMEREPQTLGTIDLALAAKATGGKVYVQVERLVQRHSLDPRLVVLPAPLVDGIVLAPDAPQSAASPFDPTVTGEIRADIPRTPMPLGPERVMVSRAAGELSRGWLVNVGVGLGIDLTRVLFETGLEEAVDVTTEHGPFNGMINHRPSFGAHTNPDAIIDTTDMFTLYVAGLLNASILGMAQVDAAGNVNVSKFGGGVTGCGGFIDITTRTPHLFFCGSLAAGGVETAVENGRIRIVREGRIRKLVKQVDHVTLSGPAARRRGQSVTLVTERGLFRMTDEGWVLREVAPGIVPERDIQPMMDFELKVAPDLATYPDAVMSAGGRGFADWLSARLGRA